jgi:leucyl aminopeptidase
VTTFSFSSESPARVQAAVLVAPVFEGPVPGPGVKETGLEAVYRDARLTGKPCETLLVTRRGDDRFAAGAVLLVGVGPRDEFTVDAARRALGRVGGSLRRFGTVATSFPSAFGARQAQDAVTAAAEGLGLGAYRFTRYKTSDEESGADLKRVIALGSGRWDDTAMRTAAKRAGILVDAARWARDLVNTPAGDLPPAEIASAAKRMANTVGLPCKVWTETDLKRGGFGGILGVGRGSANPPRLIELTYTGAGKAKPIALTGKGISFDSGGLSIKDAKGMEMMKDDMGGAASVLAAMRAIAILKPKINVIAAIPCAENMPGGAAQKPGDVIRHVGGKTSEVLNTDAEGRLVLADALAHLAAKHPAAIVDAATLTGACMVALGTDVAGAIGNDDGLVRELIAAGEHVGEPTWQLPLFPGYRRLIDSNVADVKNIGDRYAGAITAGWFLAEFVGDTPWVHLDVAGPAFAERTHDLGPKGGTGVPTRTLIRFVLDRAASS